MSLPIKWISARPVAPQPFRVVGIARSGQVVGQRVDPDVHHMPWRAGTGTPQSKLVRGDRQVRQPAFDEAQYLVAPRFRANEVRIGGEEVEQRLLGISKAGRTRSPPTVHSTGVPWGESFVPSSPSIEFLLVVEGLVANRIPALVAIEIQVARIVHRLPDRLAGLVVIGFRSADETIARDIEVFCHLTEIRRHFVGKLARGHVAVARGLEPS